MIPAAVIFDFDGTLFDTSATICFAFNEVLAAEGRARLLASKIRSWIGRPLREMFPLEDPGADPSVVARRIEHYRRIFLPVCVAMSQPLPGVRECVDQLYGRVRLAIATNRKADGAETILNGHGWRNRFEIIIGIDDVQRTKPDPEAVFLAAERLGVLPAATVLVGDTPEDIQAARAAGALAVGVATGHHSKNDLLAAGAHRVVGTLAELPNLIL